MLQKQRQLDFRPSPKPAILSPVTVRSVGHYRITAPVVNSARAFTQLFWVEGGTVRYRRDGKWYSAGAGQGFYYAAMEPHHIEPQTGGADYHWITYDGNLTGEWLRENGFGCAPHMTGPYPQSLFNPLRATITRASINTEIDASVAGTRILMAFVNGPTHPHPVSRSEPEKLCRDLEGLIEGHFSDPEFGIETAAALLGLHRTTLFRIYRQHRGLTPSAYLQRVRLGKALALLKEGVLNVTEIAEATGFRDSGYFSKVIRKATGEIPKVIRGRE